MRILYCNKYNYVVGGTEAYLFELMRKMEARGNEIALFSMDHGQAPGFTGRTYLIPYLNFKDPAAGWLKKIRMGAHAVYSPTARARMRECLRDYSPDIAHIRGIYHHLSPSILWELKQQGVPVLYHVNDFKMLCPNYNFVAKGHRCEQCRGGAYFRAVTENCYPGSRLNGVALAVEAYVHKWLRTYQRCVDLFLAPSEFVRQKLVAAGLEPERIQVLSHFQEAPPDEQMRPDEGYVLYFGRLSGEKGVSELLRAMACLPEVPLVIAGDGPERARLEWIARDLNLRNVCFVGKLGGEQLDETVARCSFTVFPSRAYETLGKSILESYAWGRPVIATDIGSRREFVEHGVTGVLYPEGDRDQLVSAIRMLFERGDLAEKMGAAGRRRVLGKHDPERCADTLQEIYDRLALRRRQVSIRRVPTGRVPPRLRVAMIGGRGVGSKYSGIESYYEQVGGELVRLGHEVTVYCRSYFTPAGSCRGMRALRLPTIRSKHLETAVHTFLSSIHAMFSHYDVVHYHALGPALFSFLPRLSGKKTVVTVHGLDWQRRKWGRLAAWVLRLGELAAVCLPNATMVVSQTLQQHYREQHNRSAVYIPNGTVLLEPHGPKKLSAWKLEAHEYVLYLGRLSPEKNCHQLIEAFESLRTDMKLALAGGSSYSDAYVDGLREHASDRIIFLPWLSGDDLDQLVSNAALFVLPSDMEGLSLSLLDAMGAGVCALTSDIPENNEIVAGVGFTFRRGNQLDLQHKMDYLLRNPELRRTAGQSEQRRIQAGFLWPAIARTIEQVYYDVLGLDRQILGPTKPVHAGSKTAEVA